MTLIDFEAATAPRTARARRAAALEGALPYLAPEQTGRMNCGSTAAPTSTPRGHLLRDADRRTPFSGRDPLELLHAHLARRACAPGPRGLNTSGVPEPLSEIVLKLLAKMPEGALPERLRRWPEASARGAGRGSRARGRLRRLQPRRCPSRARCRYRRRSTSGRPSAALEAAWARVTAGARELVAVTGAAGGGKTSLVLALQEAVTGRGRATALGQVHCAGATRPTPHWASCSGRWCSSCSAPRRTRRRRGTRGSRTRSGRAPPWSARCCPSSSGCSARRRFRRSRQARPRIACGSRSRPSPARWRERPTRSCSSSTTSSGGIRVLACSTISRRRPGWGTCCSSSRTAPRTSAPGHPARKTLEDVARDGVLWQIDLPPLDEEGLTALCADTLRCEPERARPLADCSCARRPATPSSSRAAPAPPPQRPVAFGLARRVAVGFRRARAGRSHGERRRADVAQPRLPPATPRWGTRRASGTRCGWGCSPRQGCSHEETAAALGAAVREGLLVPVPEAARAEAPQATFLFAHDRVHQSAYALLAEERRRPCTSAPGASSCARPGPAGGRAALREVDHLHWAGGPTKWRGWGSPSSTAARPTRPGTAAFGAALEYLMRGIELLPEDAWRAHHDLTFALHRDALECALAIGERALAEALFGVAMASFADDARASGPLRAPHGGFPPGRRDRQALGPDGAAPPRGRPRHRRFEGHRGGRVCGATGEPPRRSQDDSPNAPPMRIAEAQACMQILCIIQMAAYMSRPAVGLPHRPHGDCLR